jgi:excisionase family DNA binding protein
MFALIAFFIGLIILFKGGFRLGTRTLTQRQGRSIALYLMAPLIVLFCASTLMIYNYIQFNQDGTFTIASDAFAAVSNTIGLVELVAVGIAVLLTIYTIYSQPRSDIRTAAVQQSAQPNPAARPPDIMTVAEAAAYMRVTEKEVLGLIDQGKLGAARIGDSYRIARIAIEDFMSGAS